MKTNYTRICGVDRMDCSKIQVTITHGQIRGDASPARMRGQATWAATRLYETGQLNGQIPVSDVRSLGNQTQISFGF